MNHSLNVVASQQDAKGTTAIAEWMGNSDQSVSHSVTSALVTFSAVGPSRQFVAVAAP